MKRGFTVLELVIVGMIVVILAAILLPALARTDGGEGGRVHCQDNLRSQVLAVTQYARDFDDRYPRAETCEGAPGWAVVLQPYLRNSDVFKCPTTSEVRPQREMREAGYTDYWINARLLAVSTREITIPSRSFAFGEGNDGSSVTRAGYSIDSFPTAWLANERSPLRRHVHGGNFAFADGHVAWLPADSIKSPLHIACFHFAPCSPQK